MTCLEFVVFLSWCSYLPLRHLTDLKNMCANKKKIAVKPWPLLSTFESEQETITWRFLFPFLSTFDYVYWFGDEKVDISWSIDIGNWPIRALTEVKNMTNRHYTFWFSRQQARGESCYLRWHFATSRSLKLKPWKDTSTTFTLPSCCVCVWSLYSISYIFKSNIFLSNVPVKVLEF